MIVWSGRGFTIMIVLLGMSFLINHFVPVEYNSYGAALSLFITGIYSRIMGKKWNNENNNRVLIDEKTGERFIVKSNHSLFWIKMQHWGIIFTVLGVLMIFRGSIIIGMIATIGLILIFIFLLIKKKIRKNQKEERINNTKTVRQKESEEKESEEEKLKRRQEKEDPNRFMPK